LRDKKKNNKRVQLSLFFEIVTLVHVNKQDEVTFLLISRNAALYSYTVLCLPCPQYIFPLTCTRK
jgi:hypothetical protein